MAGNPTFSVIGTDVTIKGDINASADLHIEGRVEGDIACASLVQGETSVVEGSIRAETARLSGRVSGSIHARELVILRTARVEGDVHYDLLTIEQGAEVDARFSHRVSSEPVILHEELEEIEAEDSDDDEDDDAYNLTLVN